MCSRYEVKNCASWAAFFLSWAHSKLNRILMIDKLVSSGRPGNSQGQGRPKKRYSREEKADFLWNTKFHCSNLSLWSWGQTQSPAYIKLVYASTKLQSQVSAFWVAVQLSLQAKADPWSPGLKEQLWRKGGRQCWAERTENFSRKWGTGRQC